MKECYKPKTSDEIQKASEEYIWKTYIDNASVQDHFIAGAEWMQEKMQESNEGQALLYAVHKTVERTKREIIKKAADWFQDYLFDVGYPDDWCRDSPNLISGKDRFIKAMQDESK